MLLGVRANHLVPDNMSYSNMSTPMISPHGVIGQRVPSQTHSQTHTPFKTHNLDLGGLNLGSKDDDSLTHSNRERSRERDNDIFARGPFDPFSKWANNPNEIKDDGWDRASANHFASRPPSPKKSSMFYDTVEQPKTALPTFPAFNPIITPPAPQSLLLPPHSNSPSPARTEQAREVAVQAGQHLLGLQALLGPLVSQLDELEKLKQELALWKSGCETANAEILQLRSESNVPSAQTIVEVGPSYTAIIIDGDTQIFHDTFLKAGPQGGQAAAQALVDGVKTTRGDALVGSTMIHVFLNKNSLGNTLVKAGIVASWPIFEGFWQGFSAFQGLISVMDVGNVQGASQQKVEAYLQHYADQLSCVGIVLASLEAQDLPENAHPKLAWIGGPTSTPETQAFAHIFRSDPLPPAPLSFSSIVMSQPQPKPSLETKDNGNGAGSSSISTTSSEPDLEIWEESQSQRDESIAQGSDDWTEAKKRSGRKTGESGRGGGGRRERERGVRRGGGLAGTPSSSGKERKPKRERGGRARRDAGVRDMKPRPCHSHYLSPKGCTNDDCHYGHEFELNENQCDELAILAKQIPCPYAKNKKCRNADESCIYGHKCPRGKDCIFEDCRFDYIDPNHQSWE